METKSLFGNYEGRCGEGFWLWPRRRVPSIPAAGCKERANAGHGQKTRRPEGFRGKGRLASLLHPAFSQKTAPLVVSKQARRGKCSAMFAYVRLIGKKMFVAPEGERSS